MNRTCGTCRFWSPTSVNDDLESGEDPVVGICLPADTDERQSPVVHGWPFSAISRTGCCPARLLTASAFSCGSWRPMAGIEPQAGEA